MFANSANHVEIRLQMTFFLQKEISVAHRAFATMLLKIRAWSDRAFNYSCAHKYRASRLTAFRAASSTSPGLPGSDVQCSVLDAQHPSAKEGSEFYLTKSSGSPRGKIL